MWLGGSSFVYYSELLNYVRYHVGESSSRPGSTRRLNLLRRGLYWFSSLLFFTVLYVFPLLLDKNRFRILLSYHYSASPPLSTQTEGRLISRGRSRRLVSPFLSLLGALWTLLYPWMVDPCLPSNCWYLFTGETEVVEVLLRFCIRDRDCPDVRQQKTWRPPRNHKSLMLLKDPSIYTCK